MTAAKDQLLLWRFRVVGRVVAWFARRPRLAKWTDVLMRRLAAITVAEHRLERKVDLHEIAEEWRRAFPKDHPITEATNDTIVAEIPTRCALHGSGDAQACWRMMAYDRALLEHIGGEFAVLESAAVTGGDRCRVAIRAAGAGFADLRQPHEDQVT